MTPGLFSWQRAVLASCLPATVQLTALRVALDSQQVTGEGVVVNAPEVADDLGCSPRTVWRHVGRLVDDEWMVQTSKPTYGGREQGGRRARYRLTLPTKSCANPRCGKSHDYTESSDTLTVGLSRDSHESCATTPRDAAGDSVSRVPNPAESCATTTPDVGTLSTSDGSTTAAAAAVTSLDHLPGPVAILATKLAQHTPLRALRWDIDADKVTRIGACIEQVGDTVLVDYALATLRHPVPTYATAFLAGWETRAASNTRHLALVKDQPCPTHGSPGTARRCNSCAADRLAGDA